jgi:drug/metabolite transporter (DMT)-like permease
MSRHEEKYFSNLLASFSLTIAATMLIFYTCINRPPFGEWYFWGMGAAVLFCVAAYLLTLAITHKVKADIRKKQRAHHQNKDQPE